METISSYKFSQCHCPKDIAPQHWQEWIESGIHPDIIASNLLSISGEIAYDFLCISPELNRRNDGRLTSYWLRRYAHCTAGMWWASGLEFFQDTEGNWSQSLMDWGCGKPNEPKTDPQSGKPIKYEHPAKTPTRIFCLQNPTQPHLWLDCLSNPRTPIIITEGAKKAACLLSLGFIAIALPGIFNGYRSKDPAGNPIPPALIPDLKLFAVPGRPVYICFDHDPKLKTQLNVNTAIGRLGALFQSAGCEVRIITLPGPEKGVDDFITAQGAAAFQRLYREATPLESWKVRRFSRLQSYDAVHVNQRYLNLDLPTSGLVVIESPMDTGKTHHLRSILAGHERVLVINNLVALTLQLANRLGLQHYQEGGSPQGKSRLVCSVDSLYKLLGCKPFNVVVLDEATQTLDHLLNSSTCSEMRERIQIVLAHLIKSASLVVIQEARCPDWCIDYIKALRGNEEPLCVINDYRPTPRQIRWLNAPDVSPAIAEIDAKLRAGWKILIATNSKQKAKSLECKLSFILGVKVRAIHGDNSQEPDNQEFLAKINQRLTEVDCLIYSPSVRAGLSIDTHHFDEVYGLFEAGRVPAWELEQQLFRNRPPVPITVWCAHRGQGHIGSASWQELINSELTSNRRSGILLQSDTESGTVGGPHLEAWAKVRALKNLSLLHQANSLKGLLIDSGHKIIEINTGSDQPTREELKQIRQQLRQEAAIATAGATDLSDFDVERLRFKDSLSEEERQSLEKFHLQKATRQEITPDLVELHQDFNLIACIYNREAMLDPDLARNRDLEEIEKLKFIPDRRHHYQSALLLRKLLEPILTRSSWTNADLKPWRESLIDPYRQAIAERLQLTINPKLSNAQIAGELLAKSGFFTQSNRVRDESTGKIQPRSYQIDPAHPVSQIVSEAIARRSAARCPEQNSVSSSDTELIHPPGLNTNKPEGGSNPSRRTEQAWHPGQRVRAWWGIFHGAWCSGVLKSVERLYNGTFKAIVQLDNGTESYVFDQEYLAEI